MYGIYIQWSNGVVEYMLQTTANRYAEDPVLVRRIVAAWY